MPQAHLTKQSIVFIDDQPSAVKYFVRALTEKGFDIVMLQSADDAWEYFSKTHSEVCAVVLDIMMPPGRYIEKEDHAAGLRTGVFLYRRILEQQKMLALQDQVLPIAILTNVTNRETFEALEAIQLEQKPLLKHRVWPKVGISPGEFADQLADWLNNPSSVPGE